MAQTPSAPPAAPVQQSTTVSSNVPPTPSPAGNNAPSNAPGGLAMGAERAAQIAEMEAMGFERAQIDLAMRAAFFNGERAIEYLLNVGHNVIFSYLPTLTNIGHTCKPSTRTASRTSAATRRKPACRITAYPCCTAACSFWRRAGRFV